mgnify:CR=1 FL=1
MLLCPNVDVFVSWNVRGVTTQPPLPQHTTGGFPHAARPALGMVEATARLPGWYGTHRYVPRRRLGRPQPRGKGSVSRCKTCVRRRATKRFKVK